MKTISEVRTVTDIKGIHFAGVRSIPKSQRSSHLELYVLDREMNRLEKEKAALGKRMNNADRRLAVLTSRTERVQKDIDGKKEVRAKRPMPQGKTFKTMKINY